MLARNVRLHGGDEIDIIALDPTDGSVVFVEVKTRSDGSGDFTPELNLTPVKKRRMSRAARKWLAAAGWDVGCRLDAVCVAAGRVV